MFTTVDKFLWSVIGPTVTTGILSTLAPLGITDKTTVGQVITIAVGAIGVYWARNKK